jgi:beta-glucanase (GH16 family)
MMEVNLKKTKTMILQKHKSKVQNLNFFIGNNPVSITNEYTYLAWTQINTYIQCSQLPTNNLVIRQSILYTKYGKH